MCVVPQHPGADVPHDRLDDAERNPPFDHVANEGVTQIVESKFGTAGLVRQARPSGIPVLLGPGGIVTEYTLCWAVVNA